MYIIVPTDFSDIALNAARYSVHMLSGQYEATLILYHVYDDAKKEEEALEKLQELRSRLMEDKIVKMECVAEKHDDVIDALERKVKHLNAALVIIGIGDKSRFEQVVTGSNSLRMIEKNACPVLVVPHHASFTKMKNIALASDFKDVRSSIPIVPVTRILKIFNPYLHIVNINSEIYVSLTDEYLEERKALQEMFAEFQPEFYFITTYDFHETLRQFITDKQIDLVLTFPRKHSFISNLLKGTNTKKLVYESAIPVLAAQV